MKPKFIINKKIIFKQIDKLNEVFDEVSYSYKTNPFIGNIINENNYSSLSIHSINEIKTIRKSINSKIWFFPFNINDEELEILFNKYKIKNFILDNEIDLNKLLNYIKINKLKINLLLRMKLKENTLFTGKHYIFGMRLDKIIKLIPILRKNKNIEKLGIHFHRKTQNVSEWTLKEEIEMSLNSDILNQIDILNLGGGLPSNYENIPINSINVIFNKILKLKEFIKKFNISLIIEPGRYIAAPAMKLESNIIFINGNTCFLDVSIFNGMMDTILANIKLKVKEENINLGKPYLLKGCTPDSADILRYRVYLDNPKIGDKITFLNCGAYTYTTDFCSLSKIEYK